MISSSTCPEGCLIHQWVWHATLPCENPNERPVLSISQVRRDRSSMFVIQSKQMTSLLEEVELLSGNVIAFTQMNTSHCHSIYHPIDKRMWFPSPNKISPESPTHHPGLDASWEQNMLVNQNLFRWVRALRKQLSRRARRINGSYSNKEDDICANVTGNTEAVGSMAPIHSDRWVRCRIKTLLLSMWYLLILDHVKL